MNYDLAKRLKDAGFPQPNFEQNKHLSWQAEAPQGHANFQETLVYCPTLSELIKACVALSTEGDFHLEKNPEDSRGKKNGGWGASVDCFKNDDYIHGSTPEEAVAELWLALNTK